MYQEYSEKLINTLRLINASEWDNAILKIKETYEADNQILTCGNGGSALTASHFITDWNKMTQQFNGRGLRGICLSDNIGLVTAYANDLNYSEIYSEQVKTYAKEGDLFIVVSGSGNSPNILKSIEAAKDLGLTTVAVVGFSGGEAAKNAHLKVHVPINDMQISEDLHLAFGHMAMKALCNLGLNKND
jgi:D-sedoheptulose 7-phosphate isomerase